MLRKLLIVSIAIMLVPLASNALAAKPGGGGGGSTTGLPSKMAALGDSITRAYNVDSNNWIEHPEHSFATGYDGGDIVSSHYERILAKNRAISGYNYNDAVSGAEMVDIAAQADRAVAQGAQYVMIEIGGNDICAGDLAGVTPVETFRAQFRAAADKLKAGLPNAKVYVMSVPDVYLLWKLYDGHWQAEFTWSSFDICQSMLDNGRTEADRQWLRSVNIQYNEVLAQESAAYGFHWDNNAVFNTQFLREDVSQVDFFHPSMKGQAKLAATTWAAGPYAGVA